MARFSPGLRFAISNSRFQIPIRSGRGPSPPRTDRALGARPGEGAQAEVGGRLPTRLSRPGWAGTLLVAIATAGSAEVDVFPAWEGRERRRGVVNGEGPGG